MYVAVARYEGVVVPPTPPETVGVPAFVTLGAAEHHATSAVQVGAALHDQPDMQTASEPDFV